MCTINEDHIIYSSWNIRCNRQKYLSLWAVFFPFQPPDNAKSPNFKIKIKHLEILSFYTFAPEMTVIWWMVPEIWSATDKICHSGLFLCPFTSLWTQKINILKKWKQTWRYYHFKNVYHKWQSYDVWFLRYGVQLTKCFVILDRYLPF